jgi:hypothetical protein
MALTMAAPALMAQSSPSTDLATRMSGTWRLNKELSPSLAAPPSGPAGGRRGGGALYALAVPQRGGRGGGGGGGAESGGMLPAEAAAQAALNVLHQVALELTVEATPDSVRFIEPRGEWNFKTDGKTTSMDVPGGAIKVKSKWDKNALRQEFSSTERKLLKSWTIDGDGRLVLTERIESITFNSKESKAVYDRQ